MKISVDNEHLFELTDIQKKVICNDIPLDVFEADMKRRLEYILMHKYERCMARLKEEWDKKLPELGVKSVPTDMDEYAALVFAQPTYQCRKTREDAAKLTEQ